VATSRAALGRRIVRMDGQDRSNIGHFAKKTLISHKMKSRYEKRPRVLEQRRGDERQHEQRWAI
jgi:hypothetical protein